MMNQKYNGHTIEFLRRLAKTIAREQQIPHHLALDEAAKKAKFNNWEHLINVSKGVETREEKNLVSQSPPDIISPGILSSKIDPYRNLLVAAANELVAKKVLSLKAKRHYDPSKEVDGYVFVELFGFRSVVIWRGISGQEVEIAVWWKYNHSLHPQANLEGNARERFTGSSPLADKSQYKEFVGVVAIGWLERLTGRYLQGKGRKGIIAEYTRKGEKASLEKLPIQQPQGFEVEGKFYL